MSESERLAKALETGDHSGFWYPGIEAAAELRRLSAELEKVRKDAERYRWLRGAAYVGGVNQHAKTCLWTLCGVFELPGRGFDAAIDAAMKGTP